MTARSDDPVTGVCLKCAGTFPVTAFRKKAKDRRGYYPVCLPCHATGEWERRRRDPVRGWARGVLANAAVRAARKSVPFALTLGVVMGLAVPVCPVLGLTLDYAGNSSTRKSGPTDTSASLDRIIPERGYVPGNLVVVSNLVNRIKTDATPSQVRAVADFYEHLLHHPA